MEMHQIRYFLAVSRTLNFTRAAEECHVSQPSLTRAIHQLEAELGGELLRRERTQSHLTDLGQRMLPLMQQCYESALAARSVAASVKTGEAAPLSIAIAHGINLGLVTASLQGLARACPGAQLRVNRGTESEVLEILKRGEADLAVAEPLDPAWERLDSWPLFSEPFQLFVSREHKLAGRKSVDLGELSESRFLVLGGHKIPDQVMAGLSASGAVAGATHQATTDDDLVALLEAGFGVAIVPASTARSERVCRVPLNGLDLQRTVAVHAVAGRRRSAAATTLLNLLRAADWPRNVN